MNGRETNMIQVCSIVKVHFINTKLETNTNASMGSNVVNSGDLIEIGRRLRLFHAHL